MEGKMKNKYLLAVATIIAITCILMVGCQNTSSKKINFEFPVWTGELTLEYIDALEEVVDSLTKNGQASPAEFKAVFYSASFNGHRLNPQIKKMLNNIEAGKSPLISEYNILFEIIIRTAEYSDMIENMSYEGLVDFFLNNDNYLML